MNIFGVGPTEMIVVLIVILVLFGPDRLPELAKKIGGASREIRDSLNSINDQMNNALETSMEVDKSRMTPPQETPALTTPTEGENSIMPPPASPALLDALAGNREISAPAASPGSSENPPQSAPPEQTPPTVPS